MIEEHTRFDDGARIAVARPASPKASARGAALRGHRLGSNLSFKHGTARWR